jgi:hypothetical protein
MTAKKEEENPQRKNYAFNIMLLISSHYLAKLILRLSRAAAASEERGGRESEKVHNVGSVKKIYKLFLLPLPSSQH